MLSDAGNKGNIKFICVARTNDKVKVASYAAKNDLNVEEYNNAVDEVLGAPDFDSKVSPGSRYRLVGDINAFNFTVDAQNRIYVVITTTSYPERIIFPMILNELIPKFKNDFGDKSLTCSQGGLDKACSRFFSKLMDEYDDPGKKDKLSQVQQQVQDVKLTMHSNIEGMLTNLGKSERIEEDTRRLQDQATRFDRQARTLKRREQCKNWQLNGIILLVIVIILIIIIVSVVNNTGGGGGGGDGGQNKNSDDSNENNDNNDNNDGGDNNLRLLRHFLRL